MTNEYAPTPHLASMRPSDQAEIVKHAPLTTEQLRIKSLRDGIDALMFECTDAQLAGLHRIHDGAPWRGLANCPENQLSATYELLRRTVMQNAKAGSTS